MKEVYPNCDTSECTTIARHACLKYSGRVGRSAAAKRFDRKAVDLAVGAHVRHAHTRYDELLALGWDRQAARVSVRGEVESTLAGWGSLSD